MNGLAAAGVVFANGLAACGVSEAGAAVAFDDSETATGSLDSGASCSRF